MPSKRLARLNEQLKREIAELVRSQVRDPRVGIVSVTGVDVSSDLSVARVRVRILGSESERSETMAGLEAAAPFLRRTLGRELRVRRVPELRFHEDRSLERAKRIEELLAEVLPPTNPEGPEEGAGEETGTSDGGTDEE